MAVAVLSNRSLMLWLFCSLFTAMALFGVWDISHNREKNHCSMSYMYENINYIVGRLLHCIEMTPLSAICYLQLCYLNFKIQSIVT